MPLTEAQRERLYKLLRSFDLEAYVEANFDKVVPSGSSELRVDCFSPNGCAGDDVRAHLWINVHKRAWICYKCGYGDHGTQKGTGFIPRFIADLERITVRQAIDRLLEEHVGTPSEDLALLLEQAFEEDDFQIPSEPPEMVMPKEFHSLHKAKGLSSKSYAAYAVERGFNKDQQQAHDMRYCVSPIPSLPRKYQNTFKKRIIWPIYDQRGTLRSAVARDMSGSKGRPKWVNWPETEPSSYLWPMGRWVPGHGWFTSSLPGTVVLTEGVINAHAVECLTPRVARACFGKKVSDDQIQLLLDDRVREVILAWDYDAKDKMIKAAKRLSIHFRVFVFPYRHPAWAKNLDFGDALDPSSPVHKAVIREMSNLIDVDSPEFCRWVNEIEIEKEVHFGF